MNTTWRSCALTLAILLAGCGKSSLEPPQRTASYSAGDVESEVSALRSAAMMPADSKPAETPPEGSADGVTRKIVYKADVELLCEDLATVAQRLETLATSAGGFVADAQLVGASGEPRWGTWKLRVPTGRFDGLLAEIKALAEVRSARTTSDDVSEEYYDVEARIRNKQQEESRLLRLLEDRTAKLDDVLAVEREIARVRGEVEQAQARLRVLANLTDLATITVHIQEVYGYQPETAAGFGARLTRSIQQSWESLVGALEALVIALAVTLPWLAVFAVPPTAAILLVRRWRRRAVMPRAA
ncbi:MAG TPA: DUF4349 domain-containing protein [Pirellulales bacterium]|nr:DUF4349 domain-containing protein [Pirellulales bacterium]